MNTNLVWIEDVSICIHRLYAHINQHESITWNQESTCHLVLSDFQELGKILSLNSQSESAASTFWVSCDPFPIGLWVERNKPQDVCFRCFLVVLWNLLFLCLLLSCGFDTWLKTTTKKLLMKVDPYFGSSIILVPADLWATCVLWGRLAESQA